MPELRAYQWLAFVLFLLSVLPRLYTNYFVFAGLILGIAVRGGKPRLTFEGMQEYGQTIMVDENFQMMGYAAVTAMVGARNLVMYTPLVIHAVLVTSQISLKRS